jgi:hypothetical protein
VTSPEQVIADAIHNHFSRCTALQGTQKCGEEVESDVIVEALSDAGYTVVDTRLVQAARDVEQNLRHFVYDDPPTERAADRLAACLAQHDGADDLDPFRGKP